MITRRLWIFSGLLLIVAVLIRFFSLNSFWVEKWYSTGIYPPIAAFLRFLFGWLPFSIGDIFYWLLLIWFLVKIAKLVRAVYLRNIDKQKLKVSSLKLFNGMCIIYIVFNVLWGINYNRRGIETQLNLPRKKYSVEDLKQINALLLLKVNETKAALLNKPPVQLSNADVFRMATDAYNEVEKNYAFLSYKPSSVKTSMWDWFGNYMSFTGYYNPFSGEAQVNTSVPQFLQPYTTCHEIAHQLGYAKENEANFVGYLAAVSSKDTLMHYSVYLDMFQYANRNLYTLDSTLAKAFRKQLIPQVKDDILLWRKFISKHKSLFEPAVRWLYGMYLQSNQQPSGVLSYDEVTGFLIAYYNKFGKI